MSARYRKFVALFIIFSLVIFFTEGQALAGELRVLDQNGLTRASRRVSGMGKVIVRISPRTSAGSMHLVLSPVDVIGREVEGRSSEDEIIFDSVKEGTWRLKGTPSGQDIVSISIGSEPPPKSSGKQHS